MGRPRQNAVYTYFDYDGRNNTSKCNLLNCGKILRGNHGANLLRHFYTQHRLEYEKILKKNKENKENIPPTQVSATALSRVFENCIALVAVHGRPFSIIEDTAFKNLISMVSGLNNDDCKSINEKNIKQRVEEKAYEVRRTICDELKGELISMKVDVASVKSRRFLGVNIQYIREGKIILRNLGVIELHERNTAVILKENIIFLISRYGIELKQLYSITSDNGANILSMSRQLDQELQASIDSQNTEATADLDPEEDVNFESDMQLLQIAESINLDETGDMNVPKITTVRCAAHTLQLAVKDACVELEDLLENCRRVARSLRSPNNALRLKESNLPQAIIDCPTRWDSTADMIERMLLFKPYLMHYHDDASSVLQILNTDDRWGKLQECLMALTPCRVLSKSLQKEQLTFGDFYLSWIKCILEIEQLNTAFAFFLVICMKTRENALMENDCFVAAMYLDPRTNSILTDDQFEMARNHLSQTYKRYEQLTVQVEITERELAVEDLPSTSANELDTFLHAQFRQRRQSLPINSETALRRSLIEFLNEPLLPSNTNILQYWENKKTSYPQLYTLSKIILATPPTQVSVERLFSSLKFVMHNLRMSLKDKIIDDILVVRNNTLYNK